MADQTLSGASPAPANIPAIEVRDLSIGYGNRTVLRHLDFRIEPGQIVTILGGSGCGKSTLLKHIIGLYAPLNGDILIWDPVLERSVELSSMGIRVDKESLLRQLAIEQQEQREKLYFHQQLLNDRLPLSIGGGIGQSRLCMVLLHKAHVGEIQASIWPDDMRRECKELGMALI